MNLLFRIWLVVMLLSVMVFAQNEATITGLTIEKIGRVQLEDGTSTNAPQYNQVESVWSKQASVEQGAGSMEPKRVRAAVALLPPPPPDVGGYVISPRSKFVATCPYCRKAMKSGAVRRSGSSVTEEEWQVEFRCRRCKADFSEHRKGPPVRIVSKQVM